MAPVGRLSGRCLITCMLLLMTVSVSWGNEPTVKTKSLCEIAYPSDSRIEWDCRSIKATDTPAKMFGRFWQDVLRFNRMDRRHFQ